MEKQSENCIMPFWTECYLCPYSDLVFPNYPDTNDFDFICSLDKKDDDGGVENEMYV